MSYAVGPIIVYIAVIITLDKEHMEVHHKVWQMAVLLGLLCGISQLFFGLPEGEGFFPQFASFYANGILLKSGGILATVIGWPLLSFCGTIGSAVILILLVFVFIMLISGSTLLGFLKTCAKPVKQMEQTYVQYREQREEKKKSRFNIDVAMSDDPPMPDHPVSSPRASFDHEEDADNGMQVLNGVTVDPRTGEVIDEILNAQKEDVSDIFKIDDTVSVGETVKDEMPLDALINKAIDDFKMSPEDMKKGSATEEPNAVVAPDPKKDSPIPMNITVEPPVEDVYHFPPISLLKLPVNNGNLDVSEELKANAAKLVDTLKSFGVQTRIINICRGPTVTRYELQPSAGVKISKITGLSDDIALNLATAGVRIEAPIPNKPAVGIEVPNRKTDIVTIREIVDSPEFNKA
ncbi:MAG: DNA translocase FtsK, partial [Oscillospiraceae bacterium]